MKFSRYIGFGADDVLSERFVSEALEQILPYHILF